MVLGRIKSAYAGSANQDVVLNPRYGWRLPPSTGVFDGAQDQTEYVTLNCTLRRAELEVTVTSDLRLRAVCTFCLQGVVPLSSILMKIRPPGVPEGSKVEISLVLTGSGCCG